MRVMAVLVGDFGKFGYNYRCQYVSYFSRWDHVDRIYGSKFIAVVTDNYVAIHGGVNIQ